MPAQGHARPVHHTKARFPSRRTGVGAEGGRGGEAAIQNSGAAGSPLLINASKNPQPGNMHTQRHPVPTTLRVPELTLHTHSRLPDAAKEESVPVCLWASRGMKEANPGALGAHASGSGMGPCLLAAHWDGESPSRGPQVVITHSVFLEEWAPFKICTEVS